MKYLKVLFMTVSTMLILGLLFGFIASFSFENMYYNKSDDSLIVIKKEDDITNFTYTINNHDENGNIVITTKGITFMQNNEVVATAIYNSNSKSLNITGNFYQKEYSNSNFKQIDSIQVYLRAIF